LRIGDKDLFFGIVAEETFVPGSDPDVAEGVFQEGFDGTVGENSVAVVSVEVEKFVGFGRIGKQSFVES
jgi:hypothetical protein